MIGVSMKSIKFLVIGIVLVGGSFTTFYAIDWWRIDKFVEQGYLEIKKGVEIGYQEAKKTVEQIGEEISKFGGFVSDVGVKIGMTVIKTVGDAGEVTLKVGTKAKDVVLQTSQAIIDSTGLALLNTGGMIWALTEGDLERFKSCAGAVDAGVRYGLSTSIETYLATVGSIDRIVTIKNVSIEASSTSLVFQGKTPKVSVAGSFLDHDFNFENMQVDLSRPDLLVVALLEKLITRPID